MNMFGMLTGVLLVLVSIPTAVLEGIFKLFNPEATLGSAPFIQVFGLFLFAVIACVAIVGAFDRSSRR